MDLNELKRRLNQHISMKLEEDSRDLTPRKSSALFEDVESVHPEYNYTEACQYIVKNLVSDIKDEKSLRSWSDIAIPSLITAGIIDSRFNELAPEEDKLIVTKFFLESEIKFHSILAKRAEGDFSYEDNFTLTDNSKPKNFITELLDVNECIKYLTPANQNVMDRYAEMIKSNKSIQDALADIDYSLSRGENKSTTKPEFDYDSDLKNISTDLKDIKNLVINNLSNRQNQDINSGALVNFEDISKLTNILNDSVAKKPQSISYSEAVVRFVKDKIDAKKWKENQISSHKSDLEMFISVIGDIRLDQIDRACVRRYRDTLAKLPPNFSRANKKFEGKSISELLKMNHPGVLTAKRVNFLVQCVSSLLDWCKNEQLISENPAKGLQIKDNSQEINDKFPFSNEDLKLIFSHPKYTEGLFKFPAYFWLPLIGLFTGMRLEEIAQLHIGDIYMEDNIWIIDINEKNNDSQENIKSVKTSSSIRLIPIHSTLINLGFIEYHKYLSEKKSIRLFPELNRTDKTVQFGKQPGKQFAALIKGTLNKPGFSAEKKSFHSLRHTFADFYKQNDLQNDVFTQIFGHTLIKLSKKRYGSPFPPVKLQTVIEKLDYGIDLSHLKNSKYINPII
ncbi:MAG: site-specific integrase [Deltaproteobacteria bacterium]|nr:site-specific integrase [Deltaproteobacteria bacterium]